MTSAKHFIFSEPEAFRFSGEMIQANNLTETVPQEKKYIGCSKSKVFFTLTVSQQTSEGVCLLAS